MISRKPYGFAGAYDSMGSSPFHINDRTSQVRVLVVTVNSQFIFKDSGLLANKKNDWTKNFGLIYSKFSI
jgi:hypothetical protein